VVITIAGGYGRNIEDSVKVHLNTVRIASELSSWGVSRRILIVPTEGTALYQEPEDPSPDGSGW